MSYLHINNLYKNQEILIFKECYAMEKIHGCLHENTLIKLFDGSFKKIKEINKGDLVKSFNEKEKKFTFEIVKDLIIQPITEHLNWHRITLSNGKQIICTEDHPFLTTKGWIAAKNLTNEYEIISE